MSDEITPPEPPRPPADNTKMAKAAAGISVLTAAGFLTGIVTKMILSRALGTLPTNNAYNYVYRLTQDIFRSWEKLIRPTFLPVLAQERERTGDRDAWHFTNSVVNLQAVLLGVVTVALMFTSRRIVGAITSFEGSSETLAARYLVFITPSLFFLSLAVTGYMLLNSYKRFHLAAFGDHVFVKLVPFIALVALYWVMGIQALILGIVVGGVGKLALYAWGLRDRLRHYRLQLALGTPAMRKLLLLMLPLVVGVLAAFGRNRIEDVFLTDVLEGRAMTIVTYAKAPVDIPIQLFPVAMSIAIFPFISEYFVRKQHTELFAVLGKGVRIIFLVFLPLTAGLILLAHPVIGVVFGGGKFTAQDVRLTAQTMQYYAAGYVFLALEILLLQFFYAGRDTLMPTVTGVATSTLQIVILYFTVKDLGVVSFTVSYSISKVVKIAVLLVLLVRLYPHAALWTPMLRRTGRELLKVTAATAVMGVVVYLLSAGLHSYLPTSKTVTGLLHLTVAVGAGLVVFVAGVHFLHVEESHQVWNWVKGKLARR